MSNATQHTVDQFVIEMGFQETVMRGLSKLEKQILPVANRLERSLGKPFSKDYSRGMQTTFKNIEKMANTSSRNIQNSLSRAFNMGNASRGLFDSYEREGLAAARNVSRAMRNAYLPATIPLSGGGLNRPRNGSPRLYGSDRISDLADRTRTSAFYGNLALRNPEQHQAYTQRLQALQEQHGATGDLHSFRSDLRSLNYEFQQTQRAASIARSASRMQAMEASSDIRGLINGLTEAALPLAGAFLTVQKAVQFFQDSIDEGAKRAQAHTMSLVAYGTPAAAQQMDIRAGQVAHDYGLDPTDTREQMAQMRMTMPKGFSNDQLATLFENESVFSHTTGMTPDALQRLNVAFQQIAASSHLMGQDLNQVINASPALVKALVDMHHLNGPKDLLQYYKDKKGSAVISDAVTAMTPTQQQRQLAQTSVIAERGRFAASQKNAMGALFDGYNSHLMRLYQSLERLFGTSGLFTDAGHVIGWFMDRLSDLVDVMASVASNVHGYMFLVEQYFSDFWNTLSPSTQKHLQELTKYFNDFFDFLLVLAGGALTKKMATGTLQRLGLISAEGAGGAAVGTAAGTATAASTAAGTAATVAEGAATATGATVAGTAAEGAGVAGAGAAGLAALPLFATGLIGYLASSQKQRDWLKDYDSNRTTTQDYQYGMVPHPSLSAPAQSYNYGQPQTQKVVIQQAPVEFKPVDVNLKFPDGSIQRVALEVVQQQHEVQMMSSQGLGGDWQSAGKNAGWSPSELLRTK